MHPKSMDLLKAWVVYYLLKCAVVFLAMLIGERLGFLSVSLREGPEPLAGVKMAWAALAIYYAVVAVLAALLFRWAVGSFVVRRMIPTRPLRLNMFLYARAWVVYAAITFCGGYLISSGLGYTISHFTPNDSAETLWTQILLKSIRPITFTVVSLLVFRWSVTRLLLADQGALAAQKA